LKKIATAAYFLLSFPVSLVVFLSLPTDKTQTLQPGSFPFLPIKQSPPINWPLTFQDDKTCFNTLKIPAMQKISADFPKKNQKIPVPTPKTHKTTFSPSSLMLKNRQITPTFLKKALKSLKK
jgi:hypothetical protein